MVGGRRLQIKQPPVAAINLHTKPTEIIVKVGVSSLNLTEFLLSCINEELAEAAYGKASCGMSNSDAGRSQLSRGGASAFSHGLSSHYGKGLAKMRQPLRALQGACLGSPDGKLSRQGTGAPASNWDQSSIGSSGS